MQRPSGFTLIELMIVIAILGILLAIAVPAYSDYTVRARVTEGLILASSAKSAVSETRLSTGMWPTGNLSSGMPTSIATTYVTDVTLSSAGDGAITVTFNTAPGKIPELGAYDDLILTPSFDSGAVIWECSGGSILQRFRPVRCRN